MKTAKSRAPYIKFPAKPALWIFAAVAFALTTGICSADSIGVACALPYVQGSADATCSGQHTVQITTSNLDSNATITTELLGLNENGALIKSFSVKNGATVQLGSRLSEASWQFTQTGSLTTVYAPVPLLHVTVQDRGLTAEAFCSDIPFLEIEQPAGNEPWRAGLFPEASSVVTDASGNNTNIVAVAPLTNPASMHLYVDGTDLLTLVPGYLACTPGAPCSGAVTINAQSVAYSNLILDIASSIGTPASNTARVTLTNLTCGEHLFRVSSAKNASYPGTVNNTCNVDSLSKPARSSVFTISITDPAPGQITIVPTPVAGEVCSGTKITGVNVNGMNLSVAGETYTPGNASTTGDVYKVAINTTLDQTDLANAVFTTHTAAIGTFDPGTNRLAVSATDDHSNRDFKNVIFATGSVAPVAIDPNAVVFNDVAIKHAVNSEIHKLVDKQLKSAMDPPTVTTLNNAFVVGLSASGAQTLFNKLCTSPVQDPSDPTINGKTPGQIFSEKVTAALLATPPVNTSINSPCSCNPPVNIQITNVTVGTDVSCNLTFNNGYFHVTMGLPSISVVADATGYCKETFLGVCTDGAAVGIQGSVDVTGVTLDFDVTADNLLNNTTSPPVFYKGNVGAELQTNITNPFGDSGISFCGISEVCKVLVQIFTFGAIDLTPSINISDYQSFSGQIGASQPDPVKLHQIQVDPTVVAAYNQKSSGSLSAVNITPAGITAGLTGQFASLAVDASLPSTPGIVLNPAPIPTLPVPNAKDIFVGISDDAINMMFANLTAAGRLQTGPPNGNGCVDTGVTVGSLLPANCDSLTLGDDLSTAAARGYCHAIKGDACGNLTFNDPMLSPTDNANLLAGEIGECYGAQGLPPGQTCASIANGNLLEWGACSITPNYNLHASEPLLFCAKSDVPPRLLLPDTPGTGGAVPAVLRIPSLSVALIVDRDQDHQVNGSFADVPGCFAPGTSTAVDCNVFSSCLTVNLDFTMAFQTCAQDGKPGFLPTFQDVQILTGQPGTVCGGTASPTSDSNVLQSSSNNQITIPLGNNGAGFAPPICGVGLDLGGFVQCTQPGVLSIETQPQFTGTRNYLAITCKVQ